MFDSVLRLFRRPPEANRTTPLRTASAEQPAPFSRMVPSPGVAESGAGLTAQAQSSPADALRQFNENLLANQTTLETPDRETLALLLANGRASAERQQQILGDPTAPPAKPKPTKFTAQCQWCLEPFDHEPRTPHELEPLRQVLLIPGHAVTAPIDICDGCYESVMTSAIRPNGRTGVIDIGSDNHGPGNMLLRQHYQ